MDLFSLVVPAKPFLLPSPRQTVHWHIAFPKFEEASPLPEFFLIEEQFIWLKANVIAKTDNSKSVPDVDFHHYLCEIVIDLDNECNGCLLFVKRAETSGTFFQSAK
jgi:hypothetical protein